MVGIRELKRNVKKISPKSTVERTHSGSGYQIFAGGQAGRLRALVLTDEENETITYRLGLVTSRAYALDDLGQLAKDLAAAFTTARGVCSRGSR
jgi:hypothetical protein